MSWAALFERAAAYEVDVEDVREALTDRRQAREQTQEDGAASREGRDG